MSSPAVTCGSPMTHRLLRPGVGPAEQALEGADHGKRGVVGRRHRVEAEAQLAVALGHDRGDPRAASPCPVGEADDRVVAAIGARDHGSRRPEVDTELHALMIAPERGRGQKRARAPDSRR